MHGRDEKCIYYLVRKPEWKRLLGRPRLRWEDNIRMDRKEIVWKGVDRMHPAEDRDKWQGLVNTPLGSTKGGVFLDYMSDC
jgi:hypothetical protein